MRILLPGILTDPLLFFFLFRFDNAEAQNAEIVAGVIMASLAYSAVVDTVARTASAEIAA